MNENARLWLDTLGTEHYPKGTRRLGGPNHGYDALGVAVLIYEQLADVYFTRNLTTREFIHRSDQRTAVALIEEYEVVFRWLGLHSPWGGTGKPQDPTITMLNDGFSRAPHNCLPMTHATMAKYLELCQKAYFKE